MSRSIVALFALSLVLSACGESRLNPFNWFGNSRESRPAPQTTSDNPLIPAERRGGLLNIRGAREEANRYLGTPVDVISGLVIERTPGGAIVRAEGLSQFQNTYDVQLTPVFDDETPRDGVLEYRLEAVVPQRPIAGGPDRLRTLAAARVLTDRQLRDVRLIRVSGAQNARETARR